MTRNQSEVNSDAALGGLDAQRWLVGILNDWRNDPLGAALASHLFGYDVCVSSEMIKADEYPNTLPLLREAAGGRRCLSPQKVHSPQSSPEGVLPDQNL